MFGLLDCLHGYGMKPCCGAMHPPLTSLSTEKDDRNDTSMVIWQEVLGLFNNFYNRYILDVCCCCPD